MRELPNHFQPQYTDASREDALFHYTTADGLNGILGTGEIWGTAYYCANDESELAAGKGILSPLFRSTTHKLIDANDSRVLTLWQRGIDIYEYADNFEQRVVGEALSLLCAYITCFCKPTNEEDFQHGLLSQWRGYGVDGGYALHFSRKKLLAAIESATNTDEFGYELQDVYYKIENPLKTEIFKHTDTFINAYTEFLDEVVKLLDFDKMTMPSPINGLTGGPLEALLDYLIHTKNKHFLEERECRLSLVQLVPASTGCQPVQYFNRGGLLVPYIKTPRSTFNILDCIEWIIVGPGPRMSARFKSVSQLIKQSGLKIKVRASHIPFTRY